MSDQQGQQSPLSDRVAIIALVVSLVALLATTGQVFQQYLATADGYRRCQESVMGGWGKRTRLRWRWRQFRFETLYTTPEIFMTDTFRRKREGQILLLGDEENVKQTYVSNISYNNSFYQSVNRSSQDELVSWIGLVYWIHETSRRAADCYEDRADHLSPSLLNQPSMKNIFTINASRLPALVPVERSWDFQPPDVIRPLAKTTLSTIAILARRMGMRWKDFRPDDGILRAEGHSHVLTSTTVRSLGLVMQYNYTGRSGHKMLNTYIPRHRRRQVAFLMNQDHEEVYIPSSIADSLGAGIVKGEWYLNIPDYTVSTQSEIISSLYILDSTGSCARQLKEFIDKDPSFTFPVADLLALTMGNICQISSVPTAVIQVPAPSDNCTGITTSILGRRTFENELSDYLCARDNRDAIPHDSSTEPESLNAVWALWQLRELLRKPYKITDANVSDEIGGEE
jgi:hypothetical protein